MAKVHYVKIELKKTACSLKMFGKSGSNLWSDVNCKNCLKQQRKIEIADAEDYVKSVKSRWIKD